MWGLPAGLAVKYLPAMQEFSLVQSLSGVWF